MANTYNFYSEILARPGGVRSRTARMFFVAAYRDCNTMGFH